MVSKYPQIQEPARRAACMWPELEIARPNFTPSHTHETVQREIEKQRIKEEILMSDIVTRRVLEAEVRQELMMERELASQRSGMGFELPMLGTLGEWRSVEERILLSLAEKERLRRGGFEAWPFQRRFDDLIRISDVRPAVKEKKRIILQVKPEEDIAGSKRKASTLPAGLDSSKSPSTDGDIISSKKVKAEWFCSVCHVSTTSEQALKEHVKGKKHESKEATKRAQRAGTNYRIGFFPKNATKSIEVPATAESSRASESTRPPLLMGNVKSDDVVLEVQKKDDPEKDEHVVLEKEESKKVWKFWCEMCRVGSHSKKVWESHKMGKKHVRRLELSAQAILL